jgi:hypothetical protein
MRIDVDNVTPEILHQRIAITYGVLPDPAGVARVKDLKQPADVFRSV